MVGHAFVNQDSEMPNGLTASLLMMLRQVALLPLQTPGFDATSQVCNALQVLPIATAAVHAESASPALHRMLIDVR